MQLIIDCFHLTIFICKWQKTDEKKKVKRTSKIWMNEFGSLPFASKMSVSTNQLHKQTELFLFLPYNKHLINRAKSVCLGES